MMPGFTEAPCPWENRAPIKTKFIALHIRLPFIFVISTETAFPLFQMNACA